MVRTMSATAVRARFGEVTRHVEESQEAVIVERHGREVVAIVPIDDFRQLEQTRSSTHDWWQALEAHRRRLHEEIGDRELTPADEIINLSREERDAQLLDLPDR